MKLIVDSGSTKTNWTLLSKEGQKVFATVGINLHYQSTKEVNELINEVKNHWNSTLSKTKNIEAIHFYGAGISNDEKASEMKRILKNLHQKIDLIKVSSDLLAASRALFGTGEGLACILGTGASTGIYNGNKIIKQVPSLGFWLGDEGSGADLGRRLIKAYLRKEIPHELMASFELEYGQFERHEVFNKMNVSDRPSSYFGSFCPFLSKHSSESFVYDLVQNAFEIFIEKNLIKYNIEPTFMIGMMGSVAYFFQDIFQRTLSRYMDNDIVILKDPMENLVTYHIDH